MKHNEFNMIRIYNLHVLKFKGFVNIIKENVMQVTIFFILKSRKYEFVLSYVHKLLG